MAMGSKLKHLFQFIRWGLLTGAASVLALGVEVLPAVADELNDWRYDSQSRSLLLTLPSNISPNVSVLSPDQLIIELRDTQIGDVPGLTVGDGLVDSIELEQISSETLWVVMEFAEGTVLAGAQSAVPVGDVQTAGQQWEIRPDLVASSELKPGAIASESTPTIAGGGADSLRPSEVDIAQADFPDLPVLEPGIRLNEPVSVPPINTQTPAVPPRPTADSLDSPVVSIPALDEGLDVAEDVQEEDDEVAAIVEVPAEPPFLGEETFEVPVINETALSGSEPEAVADEPEDESAAVASIEPEFELAPTVEADVVPGESVAAVPSLQTRVDASFSEDSISTETDFGGVDFEPEELDLSASDVTPQNTDRWPEPIPFGSPLP